MKEVRLKVEFLELSQKAFTKMIHFCKRLSMENSVLLKGPKRPSTKSLKIADLSSMFFCIIYMGDHGALMCRLKSRSLG